MSRIACASNGLVREERERSAVSLAPSRRCGELPQTQFGRLRGGIRVVARLGRLLVSRPEPERDHLVGVRFLRDPVGVGSSRCTRTAKACESEIEAVPVELDGAGLAAEPPAERVEYAVAPIKNAPETRDRVPVVRGMFLVFREPRGHRDSVRALDDRDVHSETLEHGVKLPIECGNREAITKIQSLFCTGIGGDAHEMIDEVETDLESRRLINGNTTCGETAGIKMQGDVPPVVLRWRIGKLDLPHDLEPQMECVLGWGPELKREAGQ